MLMQKPGWRAGITIFADRRDAGRALVPVLQRFELSNPLVLALPRGGVPVASEIARALLAPLDIIVVRKLGAPFQPELAIGAIALGGVRVLNNDVIAMWPELDAAIIDEITARETKELTRREQNYRGNKPFPVLKDRDVILVDDGMATGATMRAAADAVRFMQPSRVIVAVPVAAADSVRLLAEQVEDVVCLDTPSPFVAIGNFYRDFGQTSDSEVRELLAEADALGGAQ